MLRLSARRYAARVPRVASLPALALALAACGGASISEPPAQTSTATIVVDASTKAAFLAFSDSARLVTVADAASSTAWDMSIFTTTVTLNGGAGGPGTVTGFCLCANESATGDAVMAMSADAQRPTFESVGPSAIPAATGFQADVFAQHKWYRYNITGKDNQIWPVFNVYLVKRGSTVFKVQLTNYYNAAGQPRFVTIRYARLQS